MGVTKINKTRRSFIKSGLTGLAGAAMLPSVLHGEDKNKSTEKKKGRRLIYRTLGKTGIKLPVVSMGAQARDPKIYSTALDVGLVYLDTAHNYHNGNHEVMLGKIVKGKSRDSYVIGTKVYDGVDQRTGLIKKRTTADTLIKKFEISLKRLNLDCVDILYLHGVVKGETALYEPFLTAFERQKKAGKTRFIGVTTHTNEPEVIMAAAKSKVYDVVLPAYNFRQPHLKEVQKAIDYAAKAGLGIVAMKTMAGTYWDRERKHPINVKAALKWVLQNENIHTTIPGFQTYEQMELDFSVMEDLRLTPKEKADLKLGQKASLSGLYCAQCQKCVPQCWGKLNIPTLMRSYMYVYGHKNLIKAKETLKSIDLTNLTCFNCNTCQVNCTMGFDIKDRVIDIARIKDVPMDFLA